MIITKTNAKKKKSLELKTKLIPFLISNFRFLLGNSLVPEFYVPSWGVFQIVECVVQFPHHRGEVFLISNFRHVLNVVCFLLGNSSTSEFYTHICKYYPEASTKHSEHSESLKSRILQLYGGELQDTFDYSKNFVAYKIQLPGNYPEESIQ